MNQLFGLRARLNTSWEQLRMTFWFVPALMSLGAAILAFTMLAIDARLSDETLNGLPWIYGGGPEGARSLLSTVASSAITVAGTTFSITIAALSLASSQFGPRLLRTFVRDTGNQVVLGTFVATFLYCLLVLRTVRGLEDTRVVPHLSVTLAVILAIANLGVLIYFIHHAAMSIRADQVIATASKELDDAIETFFPEQIGHGLVAQEEATQGHPAPSVVPPDARTVMLDNDGYLQVLDVETLFSIATEHDLVVQLLYRPGDFIVRGEQILRFWPTRPGNDELGAMLQQAFIMGAERSGQQDVRFVLNQLVEVAARALSSGYNDSFTAITCIERLGAMLYQVAQRPFPDGRRFDDDGRLRVIAKPVRFEELVTVSFDQIRNYGHKHPMVINKLLEMLARVGAATDDEVRLASLRDQARLAYQGSIEALLTEGDRQTLTERYHGTLAALSAPQHASG